MRPLSGILGAVLGILLSIGPAVAAHTLAHSPAFDRFGAVVLGGLIAAAACRTPRR